jgi:HlyD family secretion protein
MFKKLNSFYLFIGILFVGMLSLNTQYFKGSKAFLGVTYAKKYQVNADKAATIERIYVVSGQTVAAGELLAELRSPELELEINKLEKEVENATSRKFEKQKLLESKLKLLQAEKRIIQNEIDSDIKRIENQITRNRVLLGNLLSNNQRSVLQDSLSELNLEIASIRERGVLELQAINIRMEDLRQDHEFDQSQIQANIDLTRQELEWRREEDANLNKYATFPGVIDNVYVKAGEQVEAFSPVVAINPVHPTTVVGYLVGSKDRDRKLGEEVQVRSLEQSELVTMGKIIGFGSIVELPQILQKSTAVQAFGFEIFIEINGENRLPVGEKVMIK